MVKMKIIRRIYSAKEKIYNQILKVKYNLPVVNLSDFSSDGNISLRTIKHYINLPSEFRPQFGHDDLTPLLILTKLLMPEVVVELGTARGNIVANICANSNAHVFTVNALPQQISGNVITFALNKEEIGIAYRELGFNNRVTQIYENTLTLDLSQYLEKESVDLAVIDACHDTEYVINDFLKVAPFIKKGGLVLLHDTHPSQLGHLYYSYVACMILRKKGFDIKHLNNTWWGIWQS